MKKDPTEISGVSNRMEMDPTETSMVKRVRKVVIGGARNPDDPHVFHKLSLIAFFAWIGLGADGLSSSSYGPEEAFRALGNYHHLGIFVALGTAITILVISASYSQIIELFPSGGGGYLVASKLLSPAVGMVGGCALIIDYVLTIAISIASGADAIFSFVPAVWLPYRLPFAVAGVVLLIILNLRGIKESVAPLIPIFLTFVVTHIFAIVYAFFMHAGNLSTVASNTVTEVQSVSGQVGVFGMLMLIMRSYSMGAGTYTGIEAVSNGLPILRAPQVQTGKRTMRYMASSLAITVVGLMIAYILFHAEPQEGKTLNAVLFEAMTSTWSRSIGYPFVLVTLISEALLLFVAAQTGFLGGPRVLANMATDRWFPAKFASLSDRLVTQNGVLLMGGAALVTMLASGGSVRFLIVLYSINVFITFLLSQLGMVRHWWQVRASFPGWYKKITINGIGLLLTAFILMSIIVVKFHDGGWITLAVTAALVAAVSGIRRHYNKTKLLLNRLDSLVVAARADRESGPKGVVPLPDFDPKANTAVLLVNGFNGLGLHTLFGIIRLFRGVFKNFAFVQVGVVDADVFKGSEEIAKLKAKVDDDVERYIDYISRHGYHAEKFTSIGTDVVDEVMNLAPKIVERFPQSVFFGGQLVFAEEQAFSRWLHN
ncbi:MAG: APC family permease [Pseudomonadota bacterium]